MFFKFLLWHYFYFLILIILNGCGFLSIRMALLWSILKIDLQPIDFIDKKFCSAKKYTIKLVFVSFFSKRWVKKLCTGRKRC